MTAIAAFGLVALDCPDPLALARFYSAVTGWDVDPEPPEGPSLAGNDRPHWVQLSNPNGGPTIAFQRVPAHRPPDWPGNDLPQQAHLDFDVHDLDVGEEQVLAVGARTHGTQPQPNDFRVYLDPAGHPFCLVRKGRGSAMGAG